MSTLIPCTIIFSILDAVDLDYSLLVANRMTRCADFSELELVALLTEGSTEALSELYTRHQQQLFLFLTKAAKSPMLAEDLLHDTFVRVWEHRTQIKPGQSFKPYLYSIARNQFLNLLKRARHEESILREMRWHATLESNNTEQWLNARESQQLIEEALEQLPPRCLAVFRKCHVEEFTYKQAADALGISESTVHNQMVKALRHIRAYLAFRNTLTAILIAIGIS